ncbi:MAG: motif domain protein [Pseudonocardiales bacterium]|jgi:SEC-C motif-containing protein|nr:motif domain protein [Pseudonocardiales bacterium]
MRSRYSAFALGRAGYLLDTWHPSTRPDHLEVDDRIRWTRLEIVEAVRGGPFDTTGVVEFRAHYRLADVREQLHERSTFTRQDGRWFYVRPEGSGGSG